MYMYVCIYIYIYIYMFDQNSAYASVDPIQPPIFQRP